ncbi:RNA-binding protein MEX3B-like [Branchiostoma lanceolatum]|uniref:MEX3C protein n=1 Tax=Branchiostoma lanceolatum TaxID=7740 RepID=A0A8J9ZJC2_BRALA|nr:MEX3C [Branchiostoma lanceolatum]
MPSSLFPDMEPANGGAPTSMGSQDEARALQLALDLAMLGLSGGSDQDDKMSNSGFDNDARNRKSSNMTECVPVPSSEHVAEIVGRQGCKIKALRAKTNTYIKTPVRGEEPVFVVTGRKEDVAMAKREIMSAAEHFSQIRAARKNNMNMGPGPNPNQPGQITIQVRVPYRVVGLVVGPKGATIKRIQQQTHTYIVTPSRDKEPVFEVTGMPENVDRAREEIEAHIAMRTGGLIDPVGDPDDFHRNGTETPLDHFGTAATVNDHNNYIPKGNPGHTNNYHSSSNNILPRNLSEPSNFFKFPGTNGSGTVPDFNPNNYTSSSSNGLAFDTFNNFTPGDDRDLGIGESPPFDPAPAPPSNMWAPLDLVPNSRSGSSVTAALFGSNAANGTIPNVQRRSSSISGSSGHPRLSPTLSDSNEHPTARRVRSDPLSGGPTMFTPLPGSGFSTSVSSVQSGSSTSISSSPTDSTGSLPPRSKNKKDCMICYESEVVAALVPCGHNLFCMECANRLCEKKDAECPVCHTTISQAIRIFS